MTLSTVSFGAISQISSTAGCDSPAGGHDGGAGITMYMSRFGSELSLNII